MEYRDHPDGIICSIQGCNEPALAIYDSQSGEYIYYDDKCILHCSKENEYWIQNYDEVRELLSEWNTHENINIHWNPHLLEKFMQKFESYKSPINSLDVSNMEIPVGHVINSKLASTSISDVRLSLHNCKIFDSVEVTGRANIGALNIISCKILGDLKINNLQNIHRIELHNLLIKGDLILDSLRLYSQHRQFYDVSIFNIERCNKLRISNIDFPEQCEVSLSNINADEVEIHKCSFKKSCYILTPNINKLSLADLTVKGEFHICSPEQGKIGYVSICGLKASDAHVSICDIEISELEITTTITKPKLFRISNIYNIRKLSITSSVIENCVFQSISFKNTNLNFENVNVADFKFNSIEWGDISDKKICPELIRENPAKARDIYRQLKFALDNQKDYITANMFYALEMKAHSRALQEHPWKNILELPVFYIYGCVSSYGQNWLKPLFGIFLVTLMAACVLYELPSTPSDTEIFFKSLIENFFKTLNILKIREDTGALKNKELYYTIRSLHAILVTYLTYQFIIAIRRKTKR